VRIRQTWVVAMATLAAAFSTLPARAGVLVGPLDFSDPGHYTDNFVEKASGAAISHSTDDDANGIAGDGGFVRLADVANVSTIGSVLYDPGADGIDVPAFGDFVLDFDTRTDTSRGTMGVFFRGAPLTNAAMVHIALDAGAGGADQIRFYTGNINNGQAGTLLETHLLDTALTNGDWNHVRLTVQNVVDGATTTMNATVELFDSVIGLNPGTPLMTATYAYPGFLTEGAIALRPHSGNLSSGVDSRWADFDNFTISELLAPVPEPASLVLLAGGMLGLWVRTRRK